MNTTVKRKPIKFLPDPRRVIARYFFPGPDSRIETIIRRIASMPEAAAQLALTHVLREFSLRHRNLSKIFRKHFDRCYQHMRDHKTLFDSLSEQKKLLIGAYFTNEYSIESAAFFNPSMVEDPDQSGLDNGQKRVIVSFRATGEGHISSIVFRGGILDKDNNLQFNSAGRFVDEAEGVMNFIYEKQSFLNKLSEMQIEKDIIGKVMDHLGDRFDYNELNRAIQVVTHNQELSYTRQRVIQAIKWLANSHYTISFSLDTAISERVIFPIDSSESNGIEDARFVRFTCVDGSVRYYATYTAYNGFAILPKLIETSDFYHFSIGPLHGDKAQNKGMALFPRKINGKYAVLSRIDGINNYIMFSDNINLWCEAIPLQEPRFPWEFIQVGNCGSPIETELGWLVITHGVGPMRRYSLGALLLDLDDPTKIIGQLSEPLLSANEDEREGYVPNVVYSCGGIIHNNELVIPYAMSDTASTYATIPLDELFDRLLAQYRNRGSKTTQPATAKILLVEDDPIMQKIVAEVLKSAGYGVEIAPDGIVALMQIAREKYDLVLTDINMPHFDGYQLLNYMKENGINIPLVFITGQISEEDERKGLIKGAAEYIRKPVDRDLLLMRIGKLLKT